MSYYDPHPLLVLGRSVTLVGHPGSGVAQVGYAMSAQTGLPVTEIDRLVESMAGRSRAQILVEDGWDALRRFEADALERGLARLPHGVVVAHSDTLTPPRPRARVLETTCLVAVCRPREELLRRLQARARERPETALELPGGVPGTMGELDALLEGLEPGIRAAEVWLEAGDRHPLSVAEELLHSLDRIVGAERVGLRG